MRVSFVSVLLYFWMKKNKNKNNCVLAKKMFVDKILSFQKAAARNNSTLLFQYSISYILFMRRSKCVYEIILYKKEEHGFLSLKEEDYKLQITKSWSFPLLKRGDQRRNEFLSVIF